MKNISLIGVGDISSAGIAAIFWFIIASLSGPEEYGKYLVCKFTYFSSFLVSVSFGFISYQ